MNLNIAWRESLEKRLFLKLLVNSLQNNSTGENIWETGAIVVTMFTPVIISDGVKLFLVICCCCCC